MRKSVVLTGASGFVGRRLAQRLIEHDFEVHAIDVEDPRIEGIRFIQADIGESLGDSDLAVPKYATFIHLAAISTDSASRDNPLLALTTNLLGTSRMVLLANVKIASQFIFASSEWVYPESELALENVESTDLVANQLSSLYAMTKLTGEGLLKNLSDIPSVALRFGIVYGPRAKPGSAPEAILLKARDGNSISIGNARTSRRFIFVDDLCDGILRVITSQPSPGDRVFNLAGSELISLSRLVDDAGYVCGKDARFEEDGTRASIRNPVSDKFYKEFDWTPKVSLRAGLRACLQLLE